MLTLFSRYTALTPSRATSPRFIIYMATSINTHQPSSSSLHKHLTTRTLRIFKVIGATYMLESLKTFRTHVPLPWSNQFWSPVLLMITSWKTWLQGDPRMKFSIFWTRPIYSGTPNHILALKLTPMVVNTPPLSFALTILLTLVIP